MYLYKKVFGCKGNKNSPQFPTYFQYFFLIIFRCFCKQLKISVIYICMAGGAFCESFVDFSDLKKMRNAFFFGILNILTEKC